MLRTLDQGIDVCVTVPLVDGFVLARSAFHHSMNYRSVVVLRHYEDLKLAKIAEILEIPEGTVNSRMAEALIRLSRILEPKLKQAPDPFTPLNPLNLTRESIVL